MTQNSKHKLLAGAGAALLLAGCQSTLVFTTETKFGLDVSESATQNPQITMGYERAAVASFPVAVSNNVTDATQTKDAYAVMAAFSVYYNPPKVFSSGNTNLLSINQFFATGFAARSLATNTQIGYHFGARAGSNITSSPAGKSSKN